MRPPAVAGGFDRIDSITGDKNASGDSCSNLSSAALDERTRRLGIHQIQRFERQGDCGGCAPEPNISPSTRAKGDAAALSAG